MISKLLFIFCLPLETPRHHQCFWTCKVLSGHSSSLTSSSNSHFRSTDYGTTYEKLNERVGLKTILSYLYVSPNNKRKVPPSLRLQQLLEKHSHNKARTYCSRKTAACSGQKKLSFSFLVQCRTTPTDTEMWYIIHSVGFDCTSERPGWESLEAPSIHFLLTALSRVVSDHAADWPRGGEQSAH